MPTGLGGPTAPTPKCSPCRQGTHPRRHVWLKSQPSGAEAAVPGPASGTQWTGFEPGSGAAPTPALRAAWPAAPMPSLSAPSPRGLQPAIPFSPQPQTSCRSCFTKHTVGGSSDMGLPGGGDAPDVRLGTLAPVRPLASCRDWCVPFRGPAQMGRLPRGPVCAWECAHTCVCACSVFAGSRPAYFQS